MKILITGSSGFVGKYLVDHISLQKNDNIQIYGLVHSHLLENTDKIKYFECDLTDYHEIFSIIRKIHPDIIIHLAGIRGDDLHSLLDVNVKGTKNLFNAVVSSNINSLFLVFGSSAEYGYAGEDPISEEAALKPLTNYGISKVAEILLALSYHQRFGLPVVIFRPFNIIGPGQSPDFVIGNILRQVNEFEEGKRTSLELNTLDSRRDFIDVRDVVWAIWKIINHPDFAHVCAGNIFNIGSGRNYSIKEILKLLEEITSKNYPVRYLKNYSTRNDIPSQVADIRKIQEIINFSPFFPIQKSLRDMYYSK